MPFYRNTVPVLSFPLHIKTYKTLTLTDSKVPFNQVSYTQTKTKGNKIHQKNNLRTVLMLKYNYW